MTTSFLPQGGDQGGTQVEHVLTVRPIVKRVSYEDEQSIGKFNNEREMVFFEIVENTNYYRFWAAWGPSTDQETIPEVVGVFGHPLADQVARLAVLRPNRHMGKNHLFLMSFGLERIIAEHPSLQNREFQLVIQPETNDEIADRTISGEDLLTFVKRDERLGIQVSSGEPDETQDPNHGLG